MLGSASNVPQKPEGCYVHILSMVFQVVYPHVLRPTKDTGSKQQCPPDMWYKQCCLGCSLNIRTMIHLHCALLSTLGICSCHLQVRYNRGENCDTDWSCAATLLLLIEISTSLYRIFSFYWIILSPASGSWISCETMPYIAIIEMMMMHNLNGNTYAKQVRNILHALCHSLFYT